MKYKYQKYVLFCVYVVPRLFSEIHVISWIDGRTGSRLVIAANVCLRHHVLIYYHATPLAIVIHRLIVGRQRLHVTWILW